MIYKHKSFFNKRKAFTLIELLIVIAIIGILFIVLISKVDFATDKAKATGVQTDFRSFQVAIESVAKEHAGLATFGWDTGDTNGDRIRNSYDKGDTDKDGVMDEGEVWTGRKEYTETWTGIYTLVKPGTDVLDATVLSELESAINKNLDPKLHITIGTDGTITMANQATDPWKTEYHGVYLSNAANDGQDRGALIMYSNGANQEWGSEHSIANGIVTITVPGNNKIGQDDYSIVSVYTYTNGYGEVLNITTGFSNNQMLTNGNNGNVSVTPNVTPIVREPGLHQANGEFVSWDTLVTQGIIRTKADGSITANLDTPEFMNNPNSAYLQGELVIPEGVTNIADSAFQDCTGITSVIFANSVQHIGSGAFQRCSGLKSIKLNNGLISIGTFAFQATGLQEVTIPGSVITLETAIFNAIGLKTATISHGVTTISPWMFQGNSQLETISIPTSVTYIAERAFMGCTVLTIDYKGTIEQWNTMSKSDLWSNGTTITVKCSDGTITDN